MAASDRGRASDARRPWPLRSRWFASLNERRAGAERRSGRETSPKMRHANSRAISAHDAVRLALAPSCRSLVIPPVAAPLTRGGRTRRHAGEHAVLADRYVQQGRAHMRRHERVERDVGSMRGTLSAERADPLRRGWTAPAVREPHNRQEQDYDARGRWSETSTWSSASVVTIATPIRIMARISAAIRLRNVIRVGSSCRAYASRAAA